jgi:hypothetical protein
MAEMKETPVPTATVAASFTRPADTTAYASGDLVANSTTAGSVVPMPFAVARSRRVGVKIHRCRLRKSGTGITNASFRLHLYTSSPVCANGDNGPWSTDKAATYLGAFDITVDKAMTDGAAGNGTVNVGSDIHVLMAGSATIYGLLECRGVYTPASAEAFTVTLEVAQD